MKRDRLGGRKSGLLRVNRQNQFPFSKKTLRDIRRYIKQNYREEPEAFSYTCKQSAESVFPMQDAGVQPAASLQVCESAQPYGGRNLEELLDNMGETFTEMLMRLIDEKGRKDADVYKKANVDRKLFSKIRSDRDYTPKKGTVLALAVSLELSLDETKDLLSRAGYALSMSRKSDVIVQYFIEHREYDLFLINETLFFFQQPLLGSISK